MEPINKGLIDADTFALTQEEIDYLQSFLDARDRGGFYIAYYNLTGNQQAILQAQISTFSETPGSVAYLSNVILQADNPEIYPGIYHISQRVAVNALARIRDSITDPIEGIDPGTGLISENSFIQSAPDNLFMLSKAQNNHFVMQL